MFFRDSYEAVLGQAARVEGYSFARKQAQFLLRGFLVGKITPYPPAAGKLPRGELISKPLEVQNS